MFLTLSAWLVAHPGHRGEHELCYVCPTTSGDEAHIFGHGYCAARTRGSELNMELLGQGGILSPIRLGFSWRLLRSLTHALGCMSPGAHVWPS